MIEQKSELNRAFVVLNDQQKSKLDKKLVASVDRTRVKKWKRKIKNTIASIVTYQMNLFAIGDHFSDVDNEAAADNLIKIRTQKEKHIRRKLKKLNKYIKELADAKLNELVNRIEMRGGKD